MPTDASKGPYHPSIKITGPYSPVDNLPEAWFYRDADGRIELHLQADGPRGVMHFTITIPKARKK